MSFVAGICCASSSLIWRGSREQSDGRFRAVCPRQDYYDLWLLTERFDFDLQLLRTAVERTFARRGTAMPNAMPDSLTAAFSDSPTKRT